MRGFSRKDHTHYRIRDNLYYIDIPCRSLRGAFKKLRRLVKNTETQEIVIYRYSKMNGAVCISALWELEGEVFIRRRWNKKLWKWV